MNIIKGLSLASVFVLMTGCASTSKQTSDGDEISKLYGLDILDAKMSMCGNLVPDDIVTSNFRTHVSQSPKEIFELKQGIIESWNAKIQSKVSSPLKNELYSFTIYTAYRQRSKDGNKLRLDLDRTASWNNLNTIPLGIPDRVLFSATEWPLSPYDLTYPKYSVKTTGGNLNDISKILSLLADYYGDQQPGSSEKIYEFKQHTNHWNMLSYGEKVSFHGYFTTLGEVKNTIGIFIDIPKWYRDKQSVIHKDDEGYYLALDEVDYKPEYFEYEDNYVHYLPIEYVFSLENGCSDGRLSAKIKQIIVHPDKEGYLFKSDKTLAVVKYN